MPDAIPPPPPAAEPAGSLSELLKTPDRYALGIMGGGALGTRVATSLAAAAAGFALFFFAAGFFAEWQVALLDAAKEVELSQTIEAGVYAGKILDGEVDSDSALPACCSHTRILPAMRLSHA